MLLTLFILNHETFVCHEYLLLLHISGGIDRIVSNVVKIYLNCNLAPKYFERKTNTYGYLDRLMFQNLTLDGFHILAYLLLLATVLLRPCFFHRWFRITA